MEQFRNMTKIKLNSIFSQHRTMSYIFWASNQLCYYFLEMKTCGNMPFPNLCVAVAEIYGHKVECLWKLFVFRFSSSSHSPHNNHAKLELCPKIKLNKSLFLLLLLYRCHHHRHVYISLAANRRKIFSRFSTSMVFCCRKQKEKKKRKDRNKEECCCVPKKAGGWLGEQKTSSLTFYCSPTYFLFMMLLYGS